MLTINDIEDMKPKKRKFKCEGCGKDRPCFVEINQERSELFPIEEDLHCILDDTNQTSYDWVEVAIGENAKNKRPV